MPQYSDARTSDPAIIVDDQSPLPTSQEIEEAFDRAAAARDDAREHHKRADQAIRDSRATIQTLRKKLGAPQARETNGHGNGSGHRNPNAPDL
jgi:hypothetical protein